MSSRLTSYRFSRHKSDFFYYYYCCELGVYSVDKAETFLVSESNNVNATSSESIFSAMHVIQSIILK